MNFGNLVNSARDNKFDARHFMILGCSLMAVILMLTSQSALHARVVDSGQQLNQRLADVDAENGNVAYPIPKNFQLKGFGTAKALQDTQKVTRIASLRAEEAALLFSPKDRTSCSVEAARAAANGDTSKISPCITALLSGDEDALVDLPSKMSAFFIETMNSDAPPEEMGKIMINSMMKMMEALSNGVKGSDEAPEKTAATTQ